MVRIARMLQGELVEGRVAVVRDILGGRREGGQLGLEGRRGHQIEAAGGHTETETGARSRCRQQQLAARGEGLGGEGGVVDAVVQAEGRRGCITVGGEDGGERGEEEEREDGGGQQLEDAHGRRHDRSCKNGARARVSALVRIDALEGTGACEREGRL